jgi:hypothetical protein
VDKKLKTYYFLLNEKEYKKYKTLIKKRQKRKEKTKRLTLKLNVMKMKILLISGVSCSIHLITLTTSIMNKSSSSSLENDHDHALANVKQPGSNNHKCDLCKRVFTSGNALGGHKTAHRSHILPTKKSYSCRLCNKSFSSIKALNGHMKWHSKKGSKGDASSLEQTSNYDGQKPAIDLLTYLPPRLYRTKKRCRKIVDDNDNEAVTAAQILFDMSHSRD